MQIIDLEQKGKELAEELDSYVKSHFEELIEKFVRCFADYCSYITEMQQQGKKNKIAYIHFSVLRTNIMLKKHEIRIDAFDENWYMDNEECSYCYPVNEVYSYLEKYSDIILDLWRNAQGINDLGDVYKRIFKESNIYLFYIAELIRIGMKRVIHTKEYKSVEKADCFIVGVGGFMDRFDILYKEDHTIKDSGSIKRFLQSGQKSLFSYEIYEGLDLSKGKYENLEFQYSSFVECNLSTSNFTKSRFVFCNLKNSILKDANMEGTSLFDVDFSGAMLENVNFSKAKLKHISFQGAKLKNVDFSKVILAEEIDFKDAELENCLLPESR